MTTTRESRQSRRATRHSAAATDNDPRSGNPSDHFRYALAAPIQATREAVTITESTVSQLFDIDHHTAARALLPTVARQLDDIAALLRGTPNKALRRRLIASGGQTAALAGRLAFDTGDTTRAHRYWDSAMAAAREATDGSLLACTLMYLSDAAMQRGDHNAAWQFAHRATDHAPDEPRAQAWIALQTAQAAARRGDSAAAVAELKTAQDWDLEIGPPPAPDDTAPPWTRFIDHAYLWAMAAHVYTRLGDADDAHHAAVRATDALSTTRTKTRAITLAEAAYTFAHLGGTQRAINHAIDALSTAVPLEVTQATRRLHEMTGLLPKPLDARGRELQQQLQRTATPQSRETTLRSRPAKTSQTNNQAAAASETHRRRRARRPSPENQMVK